MQTLLIYSSSSTLCLVSKRASRRPPYCTNVPLARPLPPSSRALTVHRRDLQSVCKQNVELCDKSVCSASYTGDATGVAAGTPGKTAAAAATAATAALDTSIGAAELSSAASTLEPYVAGGGDAGLAAQASAFDSSSWSCALVRAKSKEGQPQANENNISTDDSH